MSNNINPEDLARSIVIKTYKQNDIIYKEGDKSNEKMHFVFSGELCVYKTRDNKLNEINTITHGNFFGEVGFVLNQPRIATISVKSDSAKLGEISKNDFVHLVAANPYFLFNLMKHTVESLGRANDKLKRLLHDNIGLYESLTRDIPKSIDTTDNILDYVSNASTRLFNKGEKIFSEGDDKNTTMYFLISGSLSVRQSGDKLISRIEEGEFFGEYALIYDSVRSSSVVVESNHAKIAKIDKEIFKKICKLRPTFIISLLKNSLERLVITEKKITTVIDDNITP